MLVSVLAPNLIGVTHHSGMHLVVLDLVLHGSTDCINSRMFKLQMFGFLIEIVTVEAELVARLARSPRQVLALHPEPPHGLGELICGLLLCILRVPLWVDAQLLVQLLQKGGPCSRIFLQLLRRLLLDIRKPARTGSFIF